MIQVLLWLLVGSLTLNLMWILRDKENTKNVIKDKYYVYGFIIALIFGPFSIILIFYRELMKSIKLK